MSFYSTYARQLEQLIRQSPRVLLTMTTHPDGDSIGSMLAMAHVVRHFGRDYVCYSPDPIPPMFDYLLNVHPIMRDMPDSVHDYQLVIIFDTGDMARTPLVAALAKRDSQKTKVLNIDHHPTVTTWQGQSVVDQNIVDVGAGATTELLYHLFEAMGLPLNPHLATSLLTGILTDTGHFTNHGTSIHSLDVAAKLVAAGGQHQTITAATMRNKSLGTLKLWGRALSRLVLDKKTGIVSTVITLKDFRECGVDHKAGGGISNFLNSLQEGTMALVLQEEPGNKIKGSLRTTDPNVNVATFAEQFGGGGHAKAAGFMLRGRLVATKHGWRVDPVRSGENLP